MTTATTSGRALIVTGNARTAAALSQLAGMHRACPPACPRFSWCSDSMAGHTVHQSPPVPLPGDEDRLLFAETCPATGRLLYGPVLGGGDADEPVGHARMLAAQLRMAAARIDELGAT